MQIHLLGTTGYHPNERRHTACFLLPEVGIALDAGTGMFRVGKRLRTRHLDIYLSHAHLDHVVGLTYLLDTVREGGLERVTVHGESGKLAAIREHLLSGEIFPVGLPCEFRPLSREMGLPGGGRMRHFALAHPGGSIGYRLDWEGASLAYVTDTTASASAAYSEEVRGVDLLLHECNFSDDQAEQAKLTGHSCASPVAEVARRAGVKRLVLVHINPASDAADPVGLEAARAIFPATSIGEDLDVIEV